MAEIVSRAPFEPSLQTFAAFPRPAIKAGEPIHFAYDVIAEPGPGQSKHGVILSPRSDYSSWDIHCDEGTGLGVMMPRLRPWAI